MQKGFYRSLETGELLGQVTQSKEKMGLHNSHVCGLTVKEEMTSINLAVGIWLGDLHKHDEKDRVSCRDAKTIVSSPKIEIFDARQGRVRG